MDALPTDLVCVLAHRTEPDRPRPAAVGLVCRGHLDGIADDLHALPDLYDQLAHQLTGTSAGGPKVATSGGHGLTLNGDVARLRSDMHTLLTTWCRVIASEHPSRPHLPIDAAMPTLANWLATWHTWACAQPWVDDYAAGIHDTARWAWQALHPLGRRRFPVGPCAAVVACDVATRTEIRCAGLLRATLTDLDDLLPEHLRCDTCARLVPPRDWPRLATTGATLTAVQLGALWGVPLRTVQRWAEQAKWPNDGGRPARYLVEKAQETHDTKRAALTQVTGVAQDVITLVDVSVVA